MFNPIPLTDLPDAVTVLQKYGMDWLYDSSGVRYDKSTDRLCFPIVGIDKKAGTPAYITHSVGWVGKTLTRAPKWYLHDENELDDEDVERAYAYITNNTSKYPPKLLVLAEDPISALKISKADDQSIGIAMLGLTIAAPFVELLCNVSEDRTIVVWPDGDAPGIKRGTQLYQQLRFIRPNTKLFYELKKDPKDLSMHELGERLVRIREEAD